MSPSPLRMGSESAGLLEAQGAEEGGPIGILAVGARLKEQSSQELPPRVSQQS